MMKTPVQNDLRLEMALESMWIVCAHESQTTKKQLKTGVHVHRTRGREKDEGRAQEVRKDREKGKEAKEETTNRSAW